jgi:hypothetical protein
MKLKDGKKRKGWKEEITRTFEEISEDMKDVTQQEVLDDIKLYRALRRKTPEITVVAQSQEKPA